MLLENAQDVSDLFAVIRAGAAPADHDPLADIGRREPDLEPVAHDGHLQRAGLGGAAGEPSWSKNLAFSAVNWAHWPGTSSS